MMEIGEYKKPKDFFETVHLVFLGVSSTFFITLAALLIIFSYKPITEILTWTIFGAAGGLIIFNPHHQEFAHPIKKIINTVGSIVFVIVGAYVLINAASPAATAIKSAIIELEQGLNATLISGVAAFFIAFFIPIYILVPLFRKLKKSKGNQTALFVIIPLAFVLILILIGVAGYLLQTKLLLWLFGVSLAHLHISYLIGMGWKLIKKREEVKI